MQVEGIIKLIKDTEKVSDSFKKRELVLRTEEQYPQFLLLEFVQDKTELLNNYAEGEKVRVSINLRGREWVNPEGQTKYFNTIQGWRIEAENKQAEVSQQENFSPNEEDVPF